jgi:hypothetical protein
LTNIEMTYLKSITLLVNDRKTNMKQDENLENLLEAIDRLREAKKLLDAIWAENTGYSTEFSRDILWKLQNYYGFDDSE